LVVEPDRGGRQRRLERRREVDALPSDELDEPRRALIVVRGRDGAGRPEPRTRSPVTHETGEEPELLAPWHHRRLLQEVGATVAVGEIGRRAECDVDEVAELHAARLAR